VDDLKDKKIESIDYITVNKILEENRKRSFEFLVNGLDNNILRNIHG
jgi:hypothetical protein